MALAGNNRTATTLAGYEAVRVGIVDLLQAARTQAARNVNALMTASYWEIGRRIVEAEQKGRRRADYGEQMIERLSFDLTAQFGRGFSRQNLQQMRVFYTLWPIFQTVSENSPIRQTLSGEFRKLDEAVGGFTNLTSHFPLPWSAYVRLLSVKNTPARRFYEAEALRNG